MNAIHRIHHELIIDISLSFFGADAGTVPHR
jgi:hypothetical protein